MEILWVLDNELGHKQATKQPVVIESMGSPSTSSVKVNDTSNEVETDLEMTSLDDLINESTPVKVMTVMMIGNLKKCKSKNS